MQKFVMQTLKKEVSELHEDPKGMAEKFTMLENFIVDALAKEIAEFLEDKKDLAETKVKLIKEAKNKFAEVKKDFIAKGAVKLIPLRKSITKRTFNIERRYWRST